MFTGLLKKFFLAAFCKQEIIVGEAAMELGSLILIGKTRDLRLVGARPLKDTVDTIIIMSYRTGVVIGMFRPVGISGTG